MLFSFLFFVTTTLAQQKGKRIIKIDDKGFNPANLVIDVGTTIVFENIGSNQHWPASNIHPTHDIYPEFDPKMPVEPQKSWEFTFDKAGEWRFHDHLYPVMIGSIRVEGPESQSGLKKQEEEIGSLLDNIKYSILDFYFSFFPKDKELYASRQNIAKLVSSKKDSKLSYLISLIGQDRIVRNLFEQSGEGRDFNCHVFAHTIGRLSFAKEGEGAIRKNITLCHSGYQHGVMAAFINATGARNLVERLDRICEIAESNFGRLTCYHGVGHGLMAYYNNDLPTAINRCLTLGNRFKQNNCMVGVFMENIGSRVGDSVSDHPTVWLKEDDPHFPCNSIDQAQQIQNMCYSIQPDWMNHLYKNNISKTISECMKAAESARPSCFFGVGQEISFLATSGNFSKVTEYCLQVPDIANYQDRCFNAAELIVLDFWGPNLTDQGEKYCQSIPQKFQLSCANALKERLEDLKKL